MEGPRARHSCAETQHPVGHPGGRRRVGCGVVYGVVGMRMGLSVGFGQGGRGTGLRGQGELREKSPEQGGKRVYQWYSYLAS